MSHTPKPDIENPICPKCKDKASWDSKWGDWYCFRCDDGDSIQPTEKELK